MFDVLNKMNSMNSIILPNKINMINNNKDKIKKKNKRKNNQINKENNDSINCKYIKIPT